MDIFNLQRGVNFLRHSLHTKGLTFCRNRQQLLHAFGGNLCQIRQADKSLPGKIHQGQRLCKILPQNFGKLPDIGSGILICHAVKLKQMLIGKHFCKLRSVHSRSL